MEGDGERPLHRRLFWAGIALASVSLLLSLGRHGPLFRLFYEVVPGFNRFRVPARLLLGFAK